MRLRTIRTGATLALSALLTLGVAGVLPIAFAQDPAPDDALDRLLEKVENKAKSEEAPRPPKDDKAKPDDARPAKADSAAKGGQDKARKAVDKGKVEDEALDSLLEKIGSTKDEPDAKDAPRPRAAGPGEDQKPEAGKSGGERPRDQLDGEKKKLDEHLEELTGRIRRRPRQDAQDPSSGPLGQAIKKMREVEKKLGESDTGEGTRKKQQDIVKDLDGLIKQARQMASRGQGRGQPRDMRQDGQQPGQNGDQRNTAQGVGPQKPKLPAGRGVLALDKDEWGGLPPQLREEMENVFREDALPTRKRLIDRYYISINNKSTRNREK
jgi:hypothetical protein